jgi:hypothetical protein
VPGEPGFSVERLRDYAEDRLSPSERQAFEAEMARDPELAGLVEAYALSAEREPIPASTTTVDDLRLDEPRGRVLFLRVGAVAALLLIALAVFLLAQPRDSEAVTLSAIPLKLTGGGEPPTGWPALLSLYEPTGAEGLEWLRDIEGARELARFVERPMLVFIDYPGCPACEAYEKGPFRDETVGEAAQDLVLVRLSWSKAPPNWRENPGLGWPIFHLVDADLQELNGFKGYKKAPELNRWLRTAMEVVREKGIFGFPDWLRMRRLARRLFEAGSTDEPMEKLTIWGEVESEDEDGPFGRAARHDITGMERQARIELTEARKKMREGREADAKRTLTDTIDALRGTPYAADLEQVLAHIETHGEFPELRAKR